MNKKSIAKTLGIVIGAASFAGAVAAHAAPGPQLINPNDRVPFGSWGQIVQSDSATGHSVRGQVSKRHARDRLFYNTTSNTNTYDRQLHVACTAEFPQDRTEFLFSTTSDADLTLFCSSGNSLILPPTDMTLANLNGFTSYAVISARLF